MNVRSIPSIPQCRVCHGSDQSTRNHHVIVNANEILWFYDICFLWKFAYPRDPCRGSPHNDKLTRQINARVVPNYSSRPHFTVMLHTTSDCILLLTSSSSSTHWTFKDVVRFHIIPACCILLLRSSCYNSQFYHCILLLKPTVYHSYPNIVYLCPETHLLLTSSRNPWSRFLSDFRIHIAQLNLYLRP